MNEWQRGLGPKELRLRIWTLRVAGNWEKQGPQEGAREQKPLKPPVHYPEVAWPLFSGFQLAIHQILGRGPRPITRKFVTLSWPSGL